MPATPARIAFITRPYRTVTGGPSSTVEALYGDLARETDSASPIETFLDSLADAQVIVDDRMSLMSAERRRYTATVRDFIATAAGFSINQSLPTVRVIDDERQTDRTAIITEMKLNLRDGSVALTLWG